VNALRFAVGGARAERWAASPTLTFRLAVERDGEPVHLIALRTEVRIEPRRRVYASDEEEPLYALFGERPRWGETLRPLILAQTSLLVPGFADRAEVDLPVPCTYDFEVAAAKYLSALRGGDVPLLFLFSGTAFVKSESGFAVEQVPWDREARFGMPVALWRDAMDRHFPGSAWIRLSHDSLGALEAWKARNALPTWDAVVEALLSRASPGRTAPRLAECPVERR
jgi:hypothetical protein